MKKFFGNSKFSVKPLSPTEGYVPMGGGRGSEFIHIQREAQSKKVSYNQKCQFRLITTQENNVSRNDETGWLL